MRIFFIRGFQFFLFTHLFILFYKRNLTKENFRKLLLDVFYDISVFCC